MSEEIREIYEFKIKGIHQFPIGDIEDSPLRIVETNVDFNKMDTTVKILIKPEIKKLTRGKDES